MHMIGLTTSLRLTSTLQVAGEPDDAFLPGQMAAC